MLLSENGGNSGASIIRFMNQFIHSNLSNVFVTYSSVTLILLLLINIYFRLADKFDFVDRPNERSSHSIPTILGGGIIFYLSLILYFIYSGFQYPWFFAGITIITVLSLADDKFDIPVRFRMPVQLIATGCLLQELGLLNGSELWIVGLFIVLTTGIVNAYNFMDGINGITAMYSGVVLISLWVCNKYFNYIVDGRLMLFLLCSVVVFGFYNIRRKARTFAGDVGAVAMAFMLIFFISVLIKATGTFVFILFLGVYGVDSVLTILHRIYKRENIFQAHRSHLYQIMVHSGRKSHLKVAGIYAGSQAVVNVMVFSIYDKPALFQFAYSAGILVVLAVLYEGLRINYLNKSKGKRNS
tara:strand:+ start:2077 stop:3141 length:1065 start_codon:yes stop_codon:yes gene_type:complete